MLYSGHSLSEIRNHLGHEDIQSTTVYLHLDLNRKREIQKQFIEYMQSVLTRDPKIEELLGWENKEDLLAWLDSLLGRGATTGQVRRGMAQHQLLC